MQLIKNGNETLKLLKTTQSKKKKPLRPRKQETRAAIHSELSCTVIKSYLEADNATLAA